MFLWETPIYDYRDPYDYPEYPKNFLLQARKALKTSDESTGSRILLEMGYYRAVVDGNITSAISYYNRAQRMAQLSGAYQVEIQALRQKTFLLNQKKRYTHIGRMSFSSRIDRGNKSIHDNWQRAFDLCNANDDKTGAILLTLDIITRHLSSGYYCLATDPFFQNDELKKVLEDNLPKLYKAIVRLRALRLSLDEQDRLVARIDEAVKSATKYSDLIIRAV